MNDTGMPPRNIVLIGFMGCGKSTLGRELHARLGWELVDMDHEIEARAGMPVRKIFEERGEAAFRLMESGLLRELVAGAGVGRRIVSTGGGVVGCEENRVMLRKLGFVVWLRASLNAILERTARNRDRPLLDGDDPAVRVRELLQLREPLYQEASHLRVDTEGLEAHEVAVGILESAGYFFGSGDAE